MDNKINKIILFLGILLLILGQFFLLYYKQIYIFISLTAISILLFLYYYLKNYLMLTINFLLLIILTFLTIAGYVNLNKNTLPFIFFLISAIILFLITIITRDFFKITDINFNKEKIHKWEILYILFIVIISYFFYFFKLNEIPPGAVYHEGVMASHFPALERPNYMPYMPDDQANWSTFVFYLGLFFTKIFGYNIGSVRIPSAIFALLSVIAFYFLLRRLTSSFTAAMITPLFMANECFISLSRQFYPVTVLYLAPLLGMYFIIEGVYKNKWYYYLFSGFAVGFSLHGYLAGRPIILVFIIWLFFLSFIYKNKFILFNLLFFILGFIITSLPVIYTAIFHPKIFWHYVHFVDPKKGADVVTRLKQFLDAIIPHIRLFYTGGDIESLLKPAGDPFFSREPFAMILFTVGFIFCCIAFFRPVPLLLFLLLLFSFIPSFFSGTTMLKRSSMAIPAIFLIAGFVFEVINKIFLYKINNIVNNIGKKFLFTIYNICLLLIIIFNFYAPINGYFNYIIKDPEIKKTFNYHIFKYVEIIKQNENCVVYRAFPYINPVWTILLPAKINIKNYEDIFEFIFKNENKDVILIIDPFMDNVADLFKKLFDNLTVYNFIEENRNINLENSQWNQFVDCFNPYSYGSVLKIFNSDISKIRGKMIKLENSKYEIIDIYDKNFKDNYSGKYLNLKTSFFIDCNKKENKIKVNLALHNWTIKIDNKIIECNKYYNICCGIHFIEFSGRASMFGNENEPITVYVNDNKLEKECFVAIDNPYGLKVKYFNKINGWETGKEKFSISQFLYPKRYYISPISYPFSIEANGYIKPGENGKYIFAPNRYMRAMVFIDDKLVYDNLHTTNPFSPFLENIDLNKNHKYNIKLRYNFQYDFGGPKNTINLNYKKTTEKDYQPVPVDWIFIY